MVPSIIRQGLPQTLTLNELDHDITKMVTWFHMDNIGEKENSEVDLANASQ